MDKTNTNSKMESITSEIVLHDNKFLFSYSVFSAQFHVNTILSCFLEKEYSTKMCLMNDSSDICGAQLLHMSHSLHLTTLCTPVLSSTLLFIAGPSEPPSLIIIIAYILSDPSPSFQLAAAGEESQEKRKGKKLRRGPRLFAFVRSCQNLQLCGAEDLVQTAEELLCSCQSCSLMLFLRGRECRGRGQQSSARRPTSCFK